MPPFIVVLAGPNGSGKSTISKKVLDLYSIPFVNADIIEQQLKHARLIDVTTFGLTKTFIESFFTKYFEASHFVTADKSAPNIILTQNLDISLADFNSLKYEAAIIADLIRRALVRSGISFCFETVLSHPSKIQFLQAAREQGFEIESYYMTTTDPKINVTRVAKRVRDDNGHDVPTEKIIDRWYRSCKLVTDLIDVSDRMQIYDNSSSQAQLIFEVEDTSFEVFDTENTWVVEYLLSHLDKLEQEFNTSNPGGE